MVIRTLLSLAVLFCGLSAQAEFITQISAPFAPVNYLGGPFALSQNDLGATPPSLTSFAIVYDDFTFANSGTLTNLQWVGAYNDASNNPTTTALASDFKVSIYDSNGAGGAPGTLLATFDAGSANQTTVAGQPNFFSYSTNAVNGFNITAGHKYFFSAAADLDFGNGSYGVAFSNIGNGSSYQDFGDTSLTRFHDPIDYAFAANLQAVPEPSSCLLALGACSGMGLLRNRRKGAGALALLRRFAKIE